MFHYYLRSCDNILNLLTGTHIEMNNVSTTKENGCSLKTMQFGALLYKRFLHNIKDIRCYVTQLILPLIFILMALLASR